MIYNKNKVESLRQRYLEGARICVDSMENDPNPILSWSKGTVEFVDNMGTVFCKFDNGRSFGVIPGVDSFHIIQLEENLSEEMEETENPSEDLEMHMSM